MPLQNLATGSIIQGVPGNTTAPPDANSTQTALSTNIIIKVNGTAVGAIQNINVNEQRTITTIDEVGTDGHIDSAPTKSTDISGECRRIRFNRMRITEAFGRGFLHLSAQRIPFDIDIFDQWAGDGSNQIITTIKNVWIESIGYSYDSGNWIITDDMRWKAESIFSTLNGGNAATGGNRGNPLQINSVERATDVGNYRGALSSPGLITDFFSNF
jgi:hypothetical protein